MVTKEEFTVHHLEYTSAKSFAEVVTALEAVTGDISEGLLAQELNGARDKSDFERRMHSFEGDTGFMRFMMLDHGALLTLYGSPVKARFYAVGNPVLAMTMLQHDVGVALNVPVRLLVYETKEGEVRLCYDLPASLMSQLHNPAVTAAAVKLDAKLAALAESLTSAKGQEKS